MRKLHAILLPAAFKLDLFQKIKEGITKEELNAFRYKHMCTVREDKRLYEASLEDLAILHEIYNLKINNYIDSFRTRSQCRKIAGWTILTMYFTTVFSLFVKIDKLSDTDVMHGLLVLTIIALLTVASINSGYDKYYVDYLCLEDASTIISMCMLETQVQQSYQSVELPGLEQS